VSPTSFSAIAATKVNIGSLAIPAVAKQVESVATTPVKVAPVSVPTTQAGAILATQTRIAQIPSLGIAIKDVRFINPIIAGGIVGIPIETIGVPRNQVTIPISPTPDVTDQTLFEEPADASKKLYLPCYRLAEETVSGQRQYRAVFERSADGWVLTLNLEKFPAPALADASRTAKEIAHIPAVLLSYSLGNAGIRKELSFQEVTLVDGVLRATLRVGTLDEQAELFAALTARETTVLTIRRTIDVAVPVTNPSGQFYRKATRVLDDVKKPFFFDLNLHGYVFRDVSGGSTQGPRYIRHEVDGKSYYQEDARRYIFYFLPDSFKLARRPQSPHVPFMSVRFESTDGQAEHTQVTLDYFAAPYVNPDRLYAAAEKLKPQMPAALPPGSSGPVFIPLLPDDSSLTFLLGLPRADIGTGPFQERKVLVDLRTGLMDSVKMPLNPDFQSVWDAMASAAGGALFRGEVAVALGDVTEKIPFIGRMNDMVGDLFDYTETPDQSSGGIKATLSNAIESKLKINGLKAKLSRGDAVVDANINGLTMPKELGPGEQLTLDVTPVSALSGSGALDAVFDLGKVEVIPDEIGILNAMTLGKMPEYSKPITIVTFADTYEAPPDPNDQVLEVAVQIERGDAVRLSAKKTETVASVRFPLSDVIVSNEKIAAGEYRYRVTAVRKSGVRVSDWKTTTNEPLYIVSADVPSAK